MLIRRYLYYIVKSQNIVKHYLKCDIKLKRFHLSDFNSRTTKILKASTLTKLFNISSKTGSLVCILLHFCLKFDFVFILMLQQSSLTKKGLMVLFPYKFLKIWLMMIFHQGIVLIAVKLATLFSQQPDGEKGEVAELRNQ